MVLPSSGKDLGLGIDDPLAGTIALTIVLFQIQHLGVLCQEEAVDTIVMGIFAVAVVYAAARYNGDIGVFPDIEVVVDQIVHTAMGDDCRNVYGFTLGAGLDHDVNARLVRLGDNLDILRVLTAVPQPSARIL